MRCEITQPCRKETKKSREVLEGRNRDGAGRAIAGRSHQRLARSSAGVQLYPGILPIFPRTSKGGFNQ